MRTTGKATDLITFSRSSGGTALRKIAYGSELVTNGTFDTDLTGWSDLSSGSSSIAWDSSSAINLIAVDGVARARATTVTEIGKVYQISVETTSGTGLLNVGTSAGAGTYINENSISVGIETFIFTAASTVTHIQLANVVIPSTATMDNISVKEVLFDQGNLTLFNHPADIPRIEYDANGNVLGLLVEESRTNLVTYSEDFTNASWVKVANATGTTPIVTPDYAPAPYSAIGKASRLQTSQSGAGYSLLQTVISGSYTGDSSASLWVKSNTGVNQTVYFRSGATGAEERTVTPEWTRIEITTALVGSIRYLSIGSRDDIGSDVIDILIYGAQLEAGAFPTSYIPTSGSTATRAVDIASIATSEFGYRDDEGTVVVEWDATDVSYHVVNFNSNSSNRWVLYHNGVDKINGFIQDSGTVVMNSNIGPVIGGLNKTAMSISPDSGDVSQNGAAVVSDTSVSVPSISNLIIGNAESGSSYINGHIKKLTYIPRRLTNDQLVEITS